MKEKVMALSGIKKVKTGPVVKPREFTYVMNEVMEKSIQAHSSFKKAPGKDKREKMLYLLNHMSMLHTAEPQRFDVVEKIKGVPTGKVQTIKLPAEYIITDYIVRPDVIPDRFKEKKAVQVGPKESNKPGISDPSIARRHMPFSA
jgi:hypothetical protein